MEITTNELPKEELSEAIQPSMPSPQNSQKRAEDNPPLLEMIVFLEEDLDVIMEKIERLEDRLTPILKPAELESEEEKEEKILASSVVRRLGSMNKEMVDIANRLNNILVRLEI